MKFIKLYPLIAIVLSSPYLLASSSQQPADTTESLLLKQLDEERMAYRLYTELGELYPDMKPLQNIPLAEKRHFQTLATYAVSHFPTIENAELDAPFEFAATQALFDKWLAQGKVSPQAAAKVGVQLEQLDIADIDQFLTHNPDAQLTRILHNLRAGSERHLAAFQRHLPSTERPARRWRGKGRPGTPMRPQASNCGPCFCPASDS